VQQLKSEGKTDEAKAMVDSLSDEEWKAYKLVKEQVEKDKKAAKGEMPSYSDDEPMTPASVINTTLTYAKAIGTNPITAFDRIFRNQHIEEARDGIVVVKRNTGTLGTPNYKSTKFREANNADESMKLDHTIPIALGGSDDERNFKMVPTSVWQSYTPVENALIQSLKDDKINRKKAQDLIKRFKAGEITAQEVFNMLK
jgi:hypothetical protein